jgi:hypothetical protein
MQKEVLTGLVLATVLLVGVIGTWIMIEAPVGKAGTGYMMPKKLPWPGIPTTETPMPKTKPTPIPSPITTPSPALTSQPSPTPTDEPTPPSFTYEILENDICSKLKTTLTNAFTAPNPGFSPYCRGSYDPETGEWSFMLGFMYVFPN